MIDRANRAYAVAALHAAFVLGVSACSGDTAPHEVAAADANADATADTSTAAPEGPEYAAWCPGEIDAIEARVDETLPLLSLADKVSLMHGTALLPIDGTWDSGQLEAYGIPGFRMLDGPRGLSERAGVPGTAFPVGMARGATWSPELERRVGEAIGAELRVSGATVLLAPTVNTLRHPRWGRAQETYSEDSWLLGALGTAFVEGAQQHVMAVVKHYAANSIENTRLEVDVQLDEQTLREVYLPHFERIVREGQVAGVMTAYNRVNGDWASESTVLVRDILRDEWSFAGFTVSDFFWGTHNTVPALEAGLDVEMQVAQIYGEELVDAVEGGQADEALIDDAVRRILRAQWCFETPPAEAPESPPENETHLALAQEVATRSMVLLENRDAALPIRRSDAPVIIVTGPLANSANTGDRGSSHVTSTRVTTPVDGLTAAAGTAQVTARTADELTDDELSAADVVIAVVGYTDADEGEGQIAAGDRQSLALPSADIALLQRLTAASDRVVAVVVGGSAIVTDGWGDDVEAIVMAWYAGARGGDALASLLFGDDNFSGRLPISFAAEDAHLPPFDNTSTEVTYAGVHGYPWLLAESHTPLYPFGFGLSYTTFEWSNLEVQAGADGVDVSVTITNAGELAGRETVQVYIDRPNAPQGRAMRALAGAAQVEVDPGASATVTVRVPREAFRVWRDGWVIEAGPHALVAGPDATVVQPAGVVEL